MDLDKKHLLKASNQESNSMAEYFKAISHPKRLQILIFLTVNGLCDFSRLKTTTELSKTALANHLAQLEELKLIKRINRGHYDITEDGENLVYNNFSLYKNSEFSRIYTRQMIGQDYMKSVLTIKKLNNVEFKGYRVSYLAALHGCLEYLGINISKSWLYGTTGHAFVINITDQICPSGPTAWNTYMIRFLAENLGVKIEEFCASKDEPNYDKMMEKGWDFIKVAINKGNPCYGWQIGDIPEYYTIYGYDKTGYYYKGYYQTEGAGPKPWRDIGKMFIKSYSVKKIDTSFDFSSQVKNALQMALRHSSNPDDWIFKPDYSSGLIGYDRWIKWVENGKAEQFGHSYNAHVWSECRQYAVSFLNEARDRLTNKIRPFIDEAIENYEIVADNLNKVSELYPFDMNKLTTNPIEINEKSKITVKLLKNARKAESKGMLNLETIIENL
jgi:DNA-binding transcriptional ArsR family regulator